MASPPVLTPTGTTGFNRQEWMDTAEAPTTQKTVLLNSIRVFPGRILNQGNVRKYGRGLGAVLAQGADGQTDVTSTDFSATPVTITPVGRALQASWSINEEAQVDIDLGNGLSGVMEDCMAETLDAAGFAAVSSLTKTFSQAALDGTIWGVAQGTLLQNTNGNYGPGTGKSVYMALTPTQYPALRAIPEFNNADVRGDNENPNVSGIMSKAGGAIVQFSTVVLLDANGWHCPVYTEDTFIVGWDKRTEFYEERIAYMFRINAYANMGVSVLHDLRGIDLRLTASQLG